MRTLWVRSRRLVLWNVTILLLLMFAIACGAAQEPTPTATAKPVPTATPTTAPAATPTATRPGPVATPTPTSVAVSTPTPTPGVQPKRGGIYTDSGTPPVSFDGQLLANSPGLSDWIGKMYNNVFINYEGSKLECEICTEWNLENNGKTMVLTMIPGIKFHSGKEMTSTDVAYSLRMIMGEIDGIVSQRSGGIKEFIESIQTPSKYEIRINLFRPSLFVPKLLAIGPSMIYENGTTRADLEKGPKGSGPFLLKKTIPSVSWTVERNPNYFKPGLPYLDGVEMVSLPNAAATLAAFFTHKILITGSSAPDPQFEPTLESMAAARTINKAINPGGCGPQFMVFNSNKQPYSDIRMRQAANLALDRKALEKVTYGVGYSRPQLLGMNPSMEFGTPPEKIWDVVPGWGTGANKDAEIEQAKKLVKDAGYPNGLNVTHMQKLPINAGNRQGAEATQAMLKKAGINVTLDGVAAEIHDVRMQNADYIAQWYQFCLTTFDPDEVVGQYWITGASRNTVSYSNPAVDKLYIQMSSELDSVKRKALFLQIQDIIVLKDVAWAPASGADGAVWWWSELKGFDPVVFSYSWSSGRKRADKMWLDR